MIAMWQSAGWTITGPVVRSILPSCSRSARPSERGPPSCCRRPAPPLFVFEPSRRYPRVDRKSISNRKVTQVTTKTRRLLILFVLAAAVSVSGDILVLDVLQYDGPNGVALAWADRLDASDLERAAMDLRSYPAAYQVAALSKMTPGARAALWREMLSDYLRDHPKATEAQRQVVTQAIALARPELFVAAANPALRFAARRTGERLAALLGEDARVFFMSAGTKSGSTANLPIRVRLEQFMVDHFVVQAGGNCNCSRDSMFSCSFGMHCSELEGCSVQYPGCGFLGSWPCDGLCSLEIQG